MPRNETRKKEMPSNRVLAHFRNAVEAALIEAWDILYMTMKDSEIEELLKNICLEEIYRVRQIPPS